MVLKKQSVLEKKSPKCCTSKIDLVWHDDVMKWKHFLRCWPFVRGILWSPVNSPHKGQWHGALMFSFISAWINGWLNNGEAGDFRRNHAHYDVIVMGSYVIFSCYRDMCKYSFLTCLSHMTCPDNFIKGSENVIKDGHGIAFDVKHFCSSPKSYQEM